MPWSPLNSSRVEVFPCKPNCLFANNQAIVNSKSLMHLPISNKTTRSFELFFNYSNGHFGSLWFFLLPNPTEKRTLFSCRILSRIPCTKRRKHRISEKSNPILRCLSIRKLLSEFVDVTERFEGIMPTPLESHKMKRDKSTLIVAAILFTFERVCIRSAAKYDIDK